MYGTDSGNVIHFCLEEWNQSHQYKHSVSLTDIFVDVSGTRALLLDVKSQGYLYNAVSTQIKKVIYSNKMIRLRCQLRPSPYLIYQAKLLVLYGMVICQIEMFS